MPNVTPELLVLGLVWYFVFVVSTTLHEAAHAWTALKLGDRTAYEAGSVSLSPLPHMEREPAGMIFFPIISYLVAGWMIGWASAPCDPHWTIRHPRRAAIMALAGPLTNLSLALLAFGLMWLGVQIEVFGPPENLRFTQLVAPAVSRQWYGPSVVLSVMFLLNLLLFVFNLLPFPPLDGGWVLPAFLRDNERVAQYYHWTSQPGVRMLGMLVAWGVTQWIFPLALFAAIRLLYR